MESRLYGGFAAGGPFLLATQGLANARLRTLKRGTYEVFDRELDNVGFGTADVESVMGGSGNDTLTGSSVGNYISGGAGADLIHGGAGSDTLVGGAGSDGLYGDDDADFIFARDGVFDTIDGGPGTDSADVDTTPVEAPVPEAPVPASVPVASAPASAAAFRKDRLSSGPWSRELTRQPPSLNSQTPSFVNSRKSAQPSLIRAERSSPAVKEARARSSFRT